jgi:hypothetical protein
MQKTLVSRVHRLSIQARRIRGLVLKEAHGIATLPIPPSRRVAFWRRGFLGESGLIYALDQRDARGYLSDWDREMYVGFIDGEACEVTGNKLTFHHVMRSLGAWVPAIFALVHRGRLHWLIPPEIDGTGDLLGLLRQRGEAVLKPFRGSGGVGVQMLEWRDGILRVNGAELVTGDLDGLLTEGTLVCERIHQAPYAAAVFGGTENTIRLVTMWDFERGAPFVAIAVHRFGNSTSLPVDNWTGGGLSAEVDLDTGRLGPGVTYPSSGHLRWHDRHPETGALIRGVVVPGWADVREAVLRLAARMPLEPYIGWDILVTATGPCVIEANSNTDVNLLQVHRPLLADPRVRAFYRRTGALQR